ncbi:GNAT family N-acetyltransferase [Falsiroseomonas selenitidurans]|uniref:GNAT family N-acetyltransferase n=1 Tax=Falsiroseomonas selenitidurans TaxID=2716335 RepID=A0ABX1E8Q0_9PROT|nr:GNAT family N-acetyltransferase [Falsiroseomonas selenitidurans]NKC33333.1 GNAT family N-acetyltransferase [Falsiroseomonas selenitidurans]
MARLVTLSAAQAVTAIEWAAAEGWNPGLADLPCFLAQDPGLFLAMEEGAQLLSLIAATRYGADFGFIGFYIARPEARGQGHGMAVWRGAMAQLEGRLVGLDGVVAQQDNYRKSGFSLAWNNIRFGGVPVRPPVPVRGIVPAAEVPFAALAALDRSVFPAARAAYLRAWIDQPGHVALAAVQDGAATGFGVIRPAREGHKFGPLVAETPEVAEALAAALLARVPDGPVFLDVPEPHRAAVALAERLGLAPGFETARMYTGPAPAIRAERLFGVMSFELG